jgi:hypothetical protein
MPRFAARPNLSHLPKQAKELLSASRAGDPAALVFKSPGCPSLGSIAEDPPGVIFEGANGFLARSKTSCSALAAVGSFRGD